MPLKSLHALLPAGWESLRPEMEQDYFHELEAFLDRERETQTVLPSRDDVFSALTATRLADVRVVLLGQDPYHDLGQAHGLCFSVLPSVKVPPSLKNVYKELQADLGYEPASHGYLMHWATQGILMLNTVLTVRAHSANSHRKQGWETFTDAILRLVAAKPDPVVFVLWGRPAQTKKKLIDLERHVTIESPHPSPLSARRGFFGSRPFSRINASLASWGAPVIQWQLPNEPVAG